jgi:hypothetical protein
MAGFQLIAVVLITCKPFTEFPALFLCVANPVTLLGLLVELAANYGVSEGPLSTVILILTGVVLIVSILQGIWDVAQFVLFRTLVSHIPEISPPTATRMSAKRRWRIYRPMMEREEKMERSKKRKGAIEVPD